MSAHTHRGPAQWGCVLRIDKAEMLPGVPVVVVVGGGGGGGGGGVVVGVRGLLCLL